MNGACEIFRDSCPMNPTDVTFERQELKKEEKNRHKDGEKFKRFPGKIAQ